MPKPKHKKCYKQSSKINKNHSEQQLNYKVKWCKYNSCKTIISSV